jgi:hypothetical protein
MDHTRIRLASSARSQGRVEEPQEHQGDEGSLHQTRRENDRSCDPQSPQERYRALQVTNTGEMVTKMVFSRRKRPFQDHSLNWSRNGLGVVAWLHNSLVVKCAIEYKEGRSDVIQEVLEVKVVRILSVLLEKIHD